MLFIAFIVLYVLAKLIGAVADLISCIFSPAPDRGPIKDTFIHCGSYQEALRRAREAGGGKEPVHDQPHKEGGLRHFHVHGRKPLQRHGFRENPHFTYPDDPIRADSCCIS